MTDLRHGGRAGPISGGDSGLALGLVYSSFGALALVPLSAAALAFYFLYFEPNARVDAARAWEAVPCEIERVAWTRLSSTRPHRTGLVVEYRYEFAGRTYTSDRYDLLGPSGDDAYARDAFVRLKKKPPGVCFANPDDPKDAVIDRDRRPTRSVLLLPGVLAAVGTGFALKLLFSVGRLRHAATQLAEPEGTAAQPDPPRAIAVGSILGFTFAFAMLAALSWTMDGFQLLRAWSYGEIEWVRVEGSVDWSRQAAVDDATEYQVRYRVDDIEYLSRCYASKAPDTRQLEYDRERPWRGRIVGTRFHATPRIYLLFPVGGALLLLLALLAMLFSRGRDERYPQRGG